MEKKKKRKHREIENKTETKPQANDVESNLDSNNVILSEQDFESLVEADKNPPEPNEKLKNLLESVSENNVIVPTETESKTIEQFIDEVIVQHKETFDKLAEIDKPLMNIEDAARKLINGFKDHWLPGIKTRCVLMGMDRDGYYEEDHWRNLFIAWGGSSIVKK
jgi:hypothetical protein